MYQVSTNAEFGFFSGSDLSFGQTAWGESGVYVCSVASAQDLSGNGEDYIELIVLGKTDGLCFCLLKP